MKPFFFALTGAFLFLALNPAAAPAAPPAAPADPIAVTPELIDRLLGEAQGRNPGLQAAGARAAAATSALGAVRTWDDPTATFGLRGATARGTPSSMDGNLIYGVDQKLPLYGRPDLMRKVATAEATREQLAGDYETKKLRRDLEVALANLALAGREAEIAEQELEWLDATLAAADHRYRVGKASQVDWLRIQTARALAADILQTKEHESDHSAFALNRLLNRELHAPWPRIALPGLQPSLYYTPRLVEAALAAEPALQVMRQETVSAQATADLTRSQRLPEVSVGVEARQYSGDGGFREGTATVSFSVPWLNGSSHDSEWRRDQLRRRASSLAAEDYALSVREELHHHLVALDAARRQALLYRDQLIPLAEQTLASAESAWERDLGPFQDILDTHRLLLADQLALAQALADQAGMFADIALFTGARDAGALAELGGDPAAAHGSHLTNPSP